MNTRLSLRATLRNLAVIDVSYAYGPRQAVHACSFTIASGACVGLIGPNGAGKTTLLKLMAGLLRPTSGVVTFNGLPLADMTARDRARHIAFVPQLTYDLFPMRVRDLVALGRAPHQSGLGWESARDSKAIDEAMDLMQCAPWAARYLHTLSSGERQRVLIARALAQQPQLLLLDEPIAHLDPAFQLGVLQCLRHVQRATGMTIGLTLHDMNLARSYCSTIGILKTGHLIQWGPTADTATPEHLSRAFDTPIEWTPALTPTQPFPRGDA